MKKPRRGGGAKAATPQRRHRKSRIDESPLSARWAAPQRASRIVAPIAATSVPSGSGVCISQLGRPKSRLMRLETSTSGQTPFDKDPKPDRSLGVFSV